MRDKESKSFRSVCRWMSGFCLLVLLLSFSFAGESLATGSFSNSIVVVTYGQPNCPIGQDEYVYVPGDPPHWNGTDFASGWQLSWVNDQQWGFYTEGSSYYAWDGYDVNHPFGGYTYVGWGGSGPYTLAYSVYWIGLDDLHSERSTPVRPQWRELDKSDPVNTVSGSMVRDETEVIIPCPGIDLEFSRSYRSAFSYTNGPLGPRWIHSYDWHISETTDVRDIEGYTVTSHWAVVRNGEGDDFTLTMITTNQWRAHRENNWETTKTTNGDYRVYLPARMELSFNTNGVLTAIADLWGNTVTLSYTNSYPSNLLTKVEHSNGQSLTFSYDGSNRLTGVSSPSTNFSVAFSYNDQGELTNALRTASSKTQAIRYFYDFATNFCNHSITQIINAAGDIYSYAYSTNTSGQMTSYCTNVVVCTNYFQNKFVFGTNDCTTMTVSRSGASQVYDYYYDSDNLRLTKTVGPVSNIVRTIQYDEHNMEIVKDKTEDTTLNEYIKTCMDYEGIMVTNKGFGYNVEPSNFWYYTWDTNWQVMTSSTDPEGRKIEMEYTNACLSRLKLFYDSSNSYDTLFSYTTNGLVSGVTNANGHYVQFGYDTYGRLNQVTPQVGPIVNYVNNILGFTTNITMPGDSGNRVTSIDVNELGWVSKITYPDGLSETMSFDAIGNVTNHIDTAGRRTSFTYLPTRKLSSVTRQLGTSNLTTSLTYDNQFNTLKITDAKGRTVESYLLDIQDRVTSITNLETNTMSITYGVGDYVKSITRFDSTTVSNSYNSDGLLSSIQYPESTNTFTYLKNGLFVTAANEQGTISNSWSSANRLSSVASVIGDLSSEVSYAYYPAGQVSNVTSVAGTNTYSIDAADRVSSILNQASCISNPVSFNFNYNTNNGLIAEITNSVVKVGYGFDSMDRITNIVWRDSANNVLRSFAYQYDNASMITNCTLADGTSLGYSYDDVDRLTGERRVSESTNVEYQIVYSYDEVGNRLAKTNGATSVSYNYSNGCNRLTGSTATSTNDFQDVLKFDVSGYSTETIGTNSNLGQLYVSNSVSAYSSTPGVSGTNFTLAAYPLSSGTQQLIAAIGDAAGNVGYATNTVVVNLITNCAYLHNSAGCVTNITYTGSGYSENIGLTWNSQYQLTAVSTNGSECERNGYDPFGRRVWRWDGTTTNYTIYAGIQILADVDSTGGLVRSYVWCPGMDNLLAINVYTGTTVRTYFALNDHLGSVHALVDETGTVIESYRYDVFGRVLGIYNGSSQPLAESAVDNRFLWAGKEYSFKTRFYYNRHRWYDPTIGRFLSKDPSGISGGLNEFTCCDNNPVNFIDYSGMQKAKPNPVDPGDAAELTRVIIGETASLYPQLDNQGRGGVYNPANWNIDSYRSLQELRQAVAEVATRNRDVYRRDPCDDEYRAYIDAEAAALEASLALERGNPLTGSDVTRFFLRQEGVGRQRRADRCFARNKFYRG